MTQKTKGKVEVFKIQKNFKGEHDLGSPLETCAFGAQVRNPAISIYPRSAPVGIIGNKIK